MQIIPKLFESFDENVALGPDHYCFRHVSGMTKASEQRRHAFHVLRTVAALDETAADDTHVGNRLLEFQSGLPVSQRDQESLTIILIVRVGMRNRVPQQVVNRLLLSLRPKSLSTDVRPRSGEILNCQVAQAQQADYDQQKKPENYDQLLARPANLGTVCERQTLTSAPIAEFYREASLLRSQPPLQFS